MGRFLIPEAALSQHVIALGKTRSGKSSKMRLIIEHFLDRKVPVCIIDPKGDWWGLKSSADGKSPGYPIIIFGSEHARHADIRIGPRAGAGVAELVATGNRPALIDLKGMRVGERAQFFIDFAAAYFTHARGHRVLAIDEVHNFAPQGKVPDPQTGEMLHWCNRLISEGGGMGITMLSASQRPQKVHKDFVTSHETLIATRVIHKLDRDAIKDWIDACGDPALGKEVMASLAAMQRIEAWVYSPEAGFGPARLTFPMFKTFDSFKPQSEAKRGKPKGWAAVDLKEVEGNLAKVVEEARANDPKELRKKIAELEAAARKAKAAPATKPAIDKAALEAEYRRGHGDGQIRGYRMGLLDALAGYHAFERILEMINAPLEKAARDTKSRRETLEGQIKKLEAGPSTPPAPAARPAPTAKPAAAPRAPQAPTAEPAGDGSLTGAMLETLQVLAWWKAIGHDQPTRKQLGGMLGVIASGSTMRSRLSPLVSRGLIVYPSQETVALTPAGEASAPPPNTASTLVETIRASLSVTERETFDNIPPGPAEISREDLGRLLNPAAPIPAGGSTMRSRLSPLATREIVFYPTTSTVSRQDWVVG